jgi:hypothetical protein
VAKIEFKKKIFLPVPIKEDLRKFTHNLSIFNPKMLKKL